MPEATFRQSVPHASVDQLLIAKTQWHLAWLPEGKLNACEGPPGEARFYRCSDGGGIHLCLFLGMGIAVFCGLYPIDGLGADPLGILRLLVRNSTHPPGCLRDRLSRPLQTRPVRERNGRPANISPDPWDRLPAWPRVHSLLPLAQLKLSHYHA